MDAASERMEADGFAVVPEVIDDIQCDILASQIMEMQDTGAGSRTLLMQPWCAELASSLRRHPVIGRLLPRDAAAVQCTLFDKSPAKNWLVSLHQDLSIPVRCRVENPDCSGWSEQEGQVYVQPPVSVLQQLVAVRVHVDDCPAESGALRVVAKSHSQGGWIESGRRQFVYNTARQWYWSLGAERS